MYDFPQFQVKTQTTDGEFGLTIVVLFIVDILVSGCLIGSLFCSSYHYTTVYAITGASINFNVGLWRVQVSGNPSGFFGAPKLLKNIFTRLITSLQDKSLAEFQAFACATDTLVLQYIPNGCNSILVLRIASYILASCLVMAAFFMFFGALSLLVFWLNRRTLLTRRMIFFLHMLPGIVVIVGLVVYLLVGGINVELTVNFRPFIGDIDPVDLSSGFFFAAGSSMLCLITPAFMYFLIPESVCVDSSQQYDLEDDYEQQALINALNYERQQLGMIYNKPAQIYRDPSAVMSRWI